MAFTYNDNNEHPQSATFGAGINQRRADELGREWAVRGWRTDNLEKPTNTDPNLWDIFLNAAK